MVALIYKCLYVVVHFVFRQCFKMSDVHVKIKTDEKWKGVKLKTSTLNKGNLAMIFSLDLNRGSTYISFEEEEIIPPLDAGF